MEQAIRRILVTRNYEPEAAPSTLPPGEDLAGLMQSGQLDADHLLARYCTLLYAQSYNLEEVARKTALDHRTVKRYLKIESEKAD